MKRRGGTGTVTKRKDGRWEAAAYVNTPVGKRRVRRYTSTRAEAEAVLVELRKKHGSGILTDTRERKLGEYLDYWLATIKNSSSISINTYIGYEATVRLYVKPGLGEKCLTKLAPRDIKLFFDNQLRAGTSSVRNIQKQKIVLSSALKMAQQEELLERNVARLVKIPKYTPKEVVPWNVGQIGIFLDHAINDPFYPLFMLISMYGLRESEALGLSWSDVDFNGKVIHIRRQLQFHNGFHYAELKTQAGRRDLPLTEAIHKILSGVNRLDLEPLPDLVFNTGNGTPIHRRNLLRSFHRITNNAELPKSKIHNLRHSAATIYKDIGTPARDTQLLLGHSNIATTQQIYQHSSMENKHLAIELYEQKLAKVRTRSRQIQPSSYINVQEIIENNSGNSERFRTTDPRLMSPAL